LTTEKKLNLKSGMKLRVLGKPAYVALAGVETTASAKADAVIVFARTRKHLLKKGVPAVRQVAIDDVWSALRLRPKK
jgi:hypothetical protein